MNTIYKYPVTIADFPTLPSFTTDMPLNAKILSCGMQGNTLVVWALVDSTALFLAPRPLMVVLTGAAVVGNGRFIGTVIAPGGVVVHVFEWEKP